jgi:murein DD-endopeptidase MepM/ murein hydrolase activator NlpD
VQRGDTLATLLARLGISDSAAFQYLRSNAEARVLTNNLRPGRAIRAETDGDGELVNLSYSLSPSETVTIERDGDQFTTSKAELQLERRVQMKSAEIRHSLFGAADATGLPDSVTTQIAEVFSGDIDFYKDIRKGDRFQVVYEMFYHQGEFVKAGRVLTAEFINNGKTFAAVWYDNPADKEASGYYTPDGKNLRKAFLRSPLEFSRVTSGFGGRMHPIHNTWRQHTGVDYGAPSGTRIRATSDGVIEFAGRQGGYGNVVIVRHQGRFTTLYAHMSGFAPGVKTGARVSQGEVVGYVGQTGWATGPHLHYEFRVASAAVNPLTITLPAALPLEAKYLADFKQKAMPLNLRIAKMREAPLLAAANFE